MEEYSVNTFFFEFDPYGSISESVIYKIIQDYINNIKKLIYSCSNLPGTTLICRSGS